MSSPTTRPRRAASRAKHPAGAGRRPAFEPATGGEASDRAGSDSPQPRGRGWVAAWMRGRWFLVMPGAAVGLLVLLFNQWTDYTSDSVAQQSIVRTWLDAGHGTAFVPADTWIFKLPLYLGVEALPFSPGARLLIEVLVLNVVCLLLLAPAAWWLARSVRKGAGRPHPLDVVAPLIWLATLGGELGANRMQPNYRNIELGLTFMALAVAARHLDQRASPPRASPAANVNRAPALNGTAGLSRADFVRPPGDQADDPVSGNATESLFGAGDRTGDQTGVRPPSLLGQKFGAVLAAGLLALLWVDDPYFALLCGVPFAGLCLVWLVLRQRGQYRYFVAAVVVAVSLVLIAPLQNLLTALGYKVLSSGTGTDIGAVQLREHFRLLGPAIAAQLGLADSDPASIVPGTGRFLSLPAAGANTLILLLAVLSGLVLSWHGWRSRQLLPAYLGLHWLLVVAGFLVSAHVSEVAHGRYLILAFYDLAVTLAVVLPMLRARWPQVANGVIMLLAASLALNVASAVLTAPTVFQHQWERLSANEPGPAGPVAERAIQDAVASTGLRRGYAQFWSANLTLYRSGGYASVNSVTCVGGHLGAENWLTDTARRTVPSPGGTFLIWEPANAHFWGCPESAIQAQFGDPVRRIPAGPGVTILVYATDIGPLIPAQDLATAG